MTAKGEKMETICICPECEREIVLKTPLELGSWLICPHCDLDLVVISLDPHILDVAPYGPEIAGFPYRLMWRQH